MEATPMTTPSPDAFTPRYTPRIFLSHSHHDEALLRPTVIYLWSHGVITWYDEQNLVWGDSLRRVEERLALCNWFVIAESPAALASMWVTEEVGAALVRMRAGEMRGIIRLLVEPHDAHITPPLWTTFPTYDATTDLTGALDDMLEAMRAGDALWAARQGQLFNAAAGILLPSPVARTHVSVAREQYVRASITAAFAAGDWQGVVDTTDSLVNGYPHAVTTDDLHMRGRALMELGRMAEAATALSDAYQRASYNPPIVRDYAQVLILDGRYAEAEALVRRALDLATDDEFQVELLAEYVRALQAQGQWEAALTGADLALGLRPHDIDWLDRRIQALIALERDDPTLTALYQQTRAELAGMPAPPEITRWLTIAYATRAAYPSFSDDDEGGDDTEERERERNYRIKMIPRLDNLREAIDQNPDMPPELRERLKHVYDVVMSPVNNLRTVYLTMGLSATMAGQPIAHAQQAAREFVRVCGLEYTSIGLIGYSDDVRIYQHATRDLALLDVAIARLEAGAVGASASAQPFTTLCSLMRRASGRRYGLVLVDGAWERPDHGIACAQECRDAGIEIFAVGFGAAEPEFLRAVAYTHDRSLLTTQAELPTAFTAVARALTEP